MQEYNTDRRWPLREAVQVAVGTGGGACEGQSETGDTEGTRGTWVGCTEAEKDAVRPEELGANEGGEREKGPGVNVEQCLVKVV